MRRCGKDVRHEPHEWIDGALRKECDGRTRNETMVGQLTVGELRAALDGEQDGALVIVDMWMIGPVQLDPDRKKGGPVFTLKAWEPS